MERKSVGGRERRSFQLPNLQQDDQCRRCTTSDAHTLSHTPSHTTAPHRVDAGQLLVEKPRQRQATLAAVAGADPLPHSQVDCVEREKAKHSLPGRVRAVLLALEDRQTERQTDRLLDSTGRETKCEEQ